MKTVQWAMKETFSFASHIGKASTAQTIKVVPRFKEEAVEGRPKLTGVYHLSVTVNVADDEKSVAHPEDVIVIDDAELKDGKAYFEYAVPFHIDFPPEARSPVALNTIKPAYALAENGCFDIMWEIECRYEEEGIEKARHVEREKEEQKEADVAAANDSAQAKSEKPTETAETDENEREKVSQTAVASENADILAFMEELEDGIAKKSFQLNDIFMQ